MENVVEKLVALAPPPETPSLTPRSGDWNRIERKINISFPDDYKQLLKAYGHGQWQGFWYLLNPRVHDEEHWCSAEDDTIGSTDLQVLRAVRAAEQEDDPTKPQLPIFPEEGGLLPWAYTDNGGVFCWLTAGGRSTWPTIYYDQNPWSTHETQRLDLSCSEIVYGVVSGELPIFLGEFGGEYEFDPDGFFDSFDMDDLE